jgi:hypothetical protein
MPTIRIKTVKAEKRMTDKVTPQQVRAINRMLHDPEKHAQALIAMQDMQRRLGEQMEKRRRNEE